MPAKKTKTRSRISLKSSHLQVTNPNAAGMDIGSREHWVAIPPDRDDRPIRSFSTFTTDLEAMADWLIEFGIDTVAMESTGVYWIPAFQILEARGLQVILVNARHAKNVSGRKSDISDCEWLRQLHTYGLLQASFQPDVQTRQLRHLLRHREMLVSYAASHIQHMQKALTQMNLQLHHVITDITGITGMKIIRAIIAGERDPLVLAAFRDGRCKADEATIAQALQGHYQEELLFVLTQSLALYDDYQRHIAACDRQLEALLATFPRTHEVSMPTETLADAPQKKTRPKKVAPNAPTFDVARHIREITGVDLLAVNGFNTATILGIFGEIGMDMGKWRTDKHFCSWLALSPNNRISGGKILTRQTKKVNSRANQLFRLAAQGAANSDSALGAYYRRLKARIGAPKAMIAVARKLACLFYRIMKDKSQYHQMTAAEYESKFKEQQIKYIKKRAKALGLQLVEDITLN